MHADIVQNNGNISKYDKQRNLGTVSEPSEMKQLKCELLK